MVGSNCFYAFDVFSLNRHRLPTSSQLSELSFQEHVDFSSSSESSEESSDLNDKVVSETSEEESGEAQFSQENNSQVTHVSDSEGESQD